jgi:hypothetical protein
MEQLMNSTSQLSKPQMREWPSWVKGSIPNPLDIFAPPQNLVQPILPGWVLGSMINVTEQNSSAPDTERDIVSVHSYGRQLGRVIDALAAVIAELPTVNRDLKVFEELMKLRREIDAIKLRAAATRLDHIVADLTTLKEAKPEEYERLAAKLREALNGL